MRSLVAGMLLCAVSVPSFAAAPEHRGLWIGTAGYDTPAECEALVARAARANLNVLYPLVWYNGGQAWYRSRLSPMARGVSPDFDPLGYLLTLAHARGMEVHAWFVNGHYGDSGPGVVFAKHPDWAMQGESGPMDWYDLGKPAVRRFETSVMIDCLRNYPVDGLHFDYIRYDGQDLCYCDHCQQEFAARYGFAPRGRSRTLPAAASLSGNPLAEPTTAQVIAVLDDGQPAIATNRLGRGEVILLNWMAQRNGPQGVSDFLSKTLARFGATERGAYQIATRPTTDKYGSGYQEGVQEWLRALGCRTTIVDETKLTSIPPDATVVLGMQYYLPDDCAAWLRDFVAAGGHCLVIDGPVFSMGNPDLQQVLGFRRSGKYFAGLRTISPVAGQDLLPSGPALDLAQEQLRQQKWVEYRKWTVTQLVRSVRRESLAVRPEAKLSAAVFLDRQAGETVCQDWYSWLDEGLVDYVIPMAYLMDNAALERVLKEYKAYDDRMARIIPGLSVYQSGGQGGVSSRPPELVLSQEKLCRDYGARGVNYFSDHDLSEEIVAGLATGPYREPADIYYPQQRR